MSQSILDFFKQNWLLAISTPIYLVLISAEIIVSNYQHKSYYTVKETLINLWLNLVNYALGLSVRFMVLALLFAMYQFKFIHITNPYAYWFLLFIGLDLCFYLEHRSEHFSRILWAVHVTHHSSQEFNLTTGFRSSVFRPFVSVWFFLPLTLLGFKPLDILLMDAICQIYGILVHTRYLHKMPTWFETVFVSPSHHRVHHASNIVYLDRNMGMVLIIWDKWFGTFQRELEEEKVVYGLTKNYEKPHHPIGIIFHEWINLGKDIRQKGLTLKQRIQYLVNPPGWRHDQASATANQLREKIAMQPGE